MNSGLNQGAMIAAIVVAVLLFGGLGFWWLNGSKPAPPADYKPVMPPSGYSGAASSMGAGSSGGAATGTAPGMGTAPATGNTPMTGNTP